MSAVRRLDLRLAVPAAGAWVAAAALTGAPPGRAAPVAVAAAVAAVLLAVADRLVPAALGLGVAAAAATAGLHVAAVRDGPVASLGARHLRASVVVRLVRDPVPVTTAHGHRLVLADGTVLSLRRPSGAYVGVVAPVLVLAHDLAWLGLLPGQRVAVSGTFAPARHGDVAVSAVLFADRAPRLLGRPPPWQRLAGRVRAALRAACAGLPPDERGLVPGLVLGDVSAMPPPLTTAFRVTGLTHLNAVSGENVAIVIGTISVLVRRLGVGRRARPLIAAAALAAFVVLVRPSPSVLRAAVMGAVVLTGAMAGRRARPVPALAAAVLTLVLVDPFLARAPGFALSVLATAAIVTVAPRWTDALARHVPRPVAAAVAIPAAAQLACTPVIVAVFGQLTPWAVPANVLAVPAVAPATLAGVAAAAAAAPAPALGRLFAWAAALPAGWLAAVARGFARLPDAGLGWSAGGRGALLATVLVVAALATLRVTAARRVRAMLGAWPPSRSSSGTRSCWSRAPYRTRFDRCRRRSSRTAWSATFRPPT